MFKKKKKDEFVPMVAELFMPTPNCKVCLWSDTVYCSAQGLKEQSEVYNNEECKHLFTESIENHRELRDRERQFDNRTNINADDLTN